MQTAEELRLQDDREKLRFMTLSSVKLGKHTMANTWRHWGPYLAERQWGTVREDYSPYGNAWDDFSHEQARSRSYRWGEDGIGGLSDNQQHLCFALALWNGNDPILKERMFGLTGSEGNHGEDVKEYYFYLDNTPSHSYMKMLYKYPQCEFPYEQLKAENKKRSRMDWEYELTFTEAFKEDRYFDIFIEYAKADKEDILIKITAINRGPDAHVLHLLPTLWYRNTWSWNSQATEKPSLKACEDVGDAKAIKATHPTLGSYYLYCRKEHDIPDIPLLFTENETNRERIFGQSNASPFVKDGINEYIIKKKSEAVNPQLVGTKVSPHYQLVLEPGQQTSICLRLCEGTRPVAHQQIFGPAFDDVFQRRKQEADEFYEKTVMPFPISEEMRSIQRQALAGLLWSKQFYKFDVQEWLNGNPPDLPSSPNRHKGRNHDWKHMHIEGVFLMPDSWEYPWFAAWDLAFHTVAMALMDPEFAKLQLLALTREDAMHLNGQLPAYEWNFSDVNPPVHAWAALRVFQIEREIFGREDRAFLRQVFDKMLLNFGWWVNKVDQAGNNVFQGGFLGMDNIGVFDRSSGVPSGSRINQSDGTAWMAMFSLNMLEMAIELARTEPEYDDLAGKFFVHFMQIAWSMEHMGEDDIPLWNEKDGFYYDVLRFPNGYQVPLAVRSMVGIIPLFAVTSYDTNVAAKFEGLYDHIQLLFKHHPEFERYFKEMQQKKSKESEGLLSIVSPSRLKSILTRVFDENEFLSPYGMRSLSKVHEKDPYTINIGGQMCQVAYTPAESHDGLFGGNSNWRGPIWFPVNFLFLESLLKRSQFHGNEFKVEFPSRSGQEITLEEAAVKLAERLVALFLKNDEGKRPIYGGAKTLQQDPYWHDYILFNEYFNGDNGAGLGASHQTGWTALVAILIRMIGIYQTKGTVGEYRQLMRLKG